ncbi:glycoside hydrolase [Actinobacillus seminis]|uniref:Lysozyme n=1 Tax=Actinobacillus seminis TaxID=722 RepID=A0A263HF28_9PAST|nr:lysozyme [Actinobacillus seminis]OZN25267.1 glycoside hydrolase [Actinobacillus seminis]SUU35989.1 endolysin [Actinobacillus seminis]
MSSNKWGTLGKVGGACSVLTIIAIMMANYGDEFRTSVDGLEIIGNAEGCRREPYKCPADVLTVGVGSTAVSGEAIEAEKIYSDLEIARRWKSDIVIAERCVNRLANGKQMPQSVFDATVSITFNVGCGRLFKSILFRKANVRDWQGVCNELPRWVYSGGRKLKGLIIRREKEKALCLSGL